ncbi:MAG TPA: bifunctional phosphoribosylaminoimidazolecarboxamide formyltransferase/IMP cyclohydrolase PurH [Flavobacteriales bacterium]|jgi:phosphoribosylaminoimidazolecarboxamide formyltransferase/IMP cyclohydrolase|nr:bifunctional phosphoribosylaminoimidazolecarboxamide formyltransferase/IMP cyclohydrolase PurH [Flavobacteriales bacterium]
MKIESALVSVYHKEGLDRIADLLKKRNIKTYSTGGTKEYLERLGLQVTAIEEVTGFPSILGGRVKTLHPAVFGGILNRAHESVDQDQLKEFGLPNIDLIVVDLYPFEDTVASGASAEEIIEKIDIGGISLIRAGAKNYKDKVIIPSKEQYRDLVRILDEKGSESTMEERKALAKKAFGISSKYDSAIFSYFSKEDETDIRIAYDGGQELRYGENPHQKGWFYGNLDQMFDKLNGKEISYNNLLDIDAAVNIIDEFDDCTVAILKHNNACGLASRSTVLESYKEALAGDPVSAFGGIIITNRTVNLEFAEKLNELFYEVLIAPEIEESALNLLSKKKNRIILKRKKQAMSKEIIRTVLHGLLVQDRDNKTETRDDFFVATKAVPSSTEAEDLLFANKIAKHTKSNTIVLAKNKQLIGSGTGQTSRIDALKQAILKARSFNLELNGAVMASDAFFPFSDSVKIAHEAGITSVIQPGGSIRDDDSINYCNDNGMSMVLTGTRHFKH